MVLKHEIAESLKEIDFVNRYEIISEVNRKLISKQEAKDIPLEVIAEIINKLNYDAEYDKKEKFFKVGVVDNVPIYKIWFNIILRSGIAEFVWVVYHNNELQLGSPWSIYSKLLISPDKIIKPPRYSNETNLKELLKSVFELYEDFKSVIIAKYSQ